MNNERINVLEKEVKALHAKELSQDGKIEKAQKLILGFKVKMGYLLMEAFGGKFHTERGFKSFDEYAEVTLGLKSRDVAYMKNIVSRATKLGIAEDKLTSVNSFDALKKVFELKDEEVDAINALLTEGTTAEGARDFIKKARKEKTGEPTAQAEKPKSLKVELSVEQFAHYEAAIAAAKSRYGVKTDAEALAIMSRDFLAMAPKAMAA